MEFMPEFVIVATTVIVDQKSRQIFESTATSYLLHVMKSQPKAK